MFCKNTMKYIDSEYKIINATPCEICGSSYIAEELEVEFINETPHHICYCTCENCGHEKAFIFSAPYDDRDYFSLETNIKN